MRCNFLGERSQARQGEDPLSTNHQSPEAKFLRTQTSIATQVYTSLIRSYAKLQSQEQKASFCFSLTERLGVQSKLLECVHTCGTQTHTQTHTHTNTDLHTTCAGAAVGGGLPSGSGHSPGDLNAGTPQRPLQPGTCWCCALFLCSVYCSCFLCVALVVCILCSCVYELAGRLPSGKGE